MTATQENRYTIAEVRYAIEAARDGRSADVPGGLRALAEEIARDTQSIYRITDADIDAYLEDCTDELDEGQRGMFRYLATQYIDQSDTLGESMQICFDLALGDVLNRTQ